MSSDAEGQRANGLSEQEPLLGERGDASQPKEQNLLANLYLGTGVVAQAGAWVLAAIVWGSVFSNDVMLFSAHPVSSVPPHQRF